MKLTQKFADTCKLPADKTDHLFRDDDIVNFCLRLRQSTPGEVSRTWLYRYRVGVKQYSLTIGSAKAVPAMLARKHAGELEAKVRLGQNPQAEKQRTRAEASNTFGALVDEYLDARKADWRHGSARQVRQHLLRHARSLHSLPIGTVSQRDIALLLNRIAQGGEVASNRLRSSLEAFFSWCLQQGHTLPAGNVVSNTAKRKEVARSRVLSDDEIKLIWNSLGDDDYGGIIKLLILTGQREAEIGRLRWEEIHDDCIDLPGERTKNGRQHIVPLSDPAKAIVEKFRMAGRTFVFGRDDRAGFAGYGPPKKKLDERTQIPAWVVHDIRRTVATGMGDIGVKPHIIEAVLNHVSGHKAGVAGVYNRSSYAAEKRDALVRWGEHVNALVQDRDAVIVPMKRA
jgi:integrase